MKTRSVTTYRKLMKVDKYLRNGLNIGYNNKAKGPSYVWYKLYKSKIDMINRKSRCSFHEDVRVDESHRCRVSDYKHSGYDRGHLANDADFDYNIKELRKTYTLSNVVPQKPYLNRYVWLGIERYARYVVRKLGYAYVINMMLYKDDVVIGDNVKVPTILYKVIMNNKKEFLKIFKCHRDTRDKKLKHHVVDFDTLVTDMGDYRVQCY